SLNSRPPYCLHSLLPTLCFSLLFLSLSSFFFHPPPTPQIYTLSLHDALPICRSSSRRGCSRASSWERWGSASTPNPNVPNYWLCCNPGDSNCDRSEERRVGKECRSEGWGEDEKKKRTEKGREERSRE